MTLSTSKYGHLRYLVALADIVALGGATSGDITLDTLPPGVILHAARVKALAAVAGGGITAATAQIKLNSTTLGSATSVFTVATDPANAIQTGAAIGGTADSNNTLKLAMTSTTSNLNAATTGQIEVTVTYSVLA